MNVQSNKWIYQYRIHEFLLKFHMTPVYIILVGYRIPKTPQSNSVADKSVSAWARMIWRWSYWEDNCEIVVLALEKKKVEVDYNPLHIILTTVNRLLIVLQFPITVHWMSCGQHFNHVYLSQI